MTREIYVSTDVETDGPIPGPHSMAQLRLRRLHRRQDAGGHVRGQPTHLPGAEGHPETMAWWKTQPEAWAECRRDLRDPGEAMSDYVAWLKTLPGNRT